MNEKPSKWKVFTAGIIRENPVLRLVLGCCSALAVTTTVSGAVGMGLAMTFVLVCSNIVISALRKVIPAKVHLPCYIVIIATFVTVVQMVLQAFVPDLYKALGVYLALIVVNCIILGRAEMFACKNRTRILHSYAATSATCTTSYAITASKKWMPYLPTSAYLPITLMTANGDSPSASTGHWICV